MSASPNPANSCQDVTFTGNNITGGLGATYTWEVRTHPGQAFVDSESGTNLNPFLWETESVTPGLYVGRLTVQNMAGTSAPAQSAVVTLNSVAPLPGGGTFAPVKVNDNSGTVTFNVQASGASEWSWDFGEGDGFGPWINDPISGPNPTHVYGSTGSKTIRAQVRNCVAGPVTSSALVIDVPVVTPLVADFSFVTCPFMTAGPTCSVNSSLTFSDNSSGASTWDYDWDCQSNDNACNTFEDSGNLAPVNSHTYTQSGNYTPKLRVKRGSSEEHVFRHAAISVVGGSPTPTPTPGPPQAQGSEFLVNSTTANSQRRPAIAADGTGQFVATWQSATGGDPETVLFAQRFSAAATRLGTQFAVNNFSFAAAVPDVAREADGDFVVVWESPRTGTQLDIFARRFNSSGTALSAELPVHLSNAEVQDAPAVAIDLDGDFVVAWESYLQDGSNDSVRARRFASSGAPLGDEIAVNLTTLDSQGDADVGSNSAGDFVVVWVSSSGDGDGDGDGVFARRFNASGGALGGEIQINTFFTGDQVAPSLATDSTGSFLVAWESEDQDGEDGGIFARAFNASGVPLTLEIPINAATSGNQQRPAVTFEQGGGFVVTWESPGSGSEVFVRRFSAVAQGALPLGDAVQVNTFIPNDQRFPAIASTAGNDFVVVWESEHQDGNGFGIFGRRFANPATPSQTPLDIDANPKTEPLTDGILFLRYLAGFRGPALIAGAVDTTNCSRCDAASIEAHLDANLASFDIDGNGLRDPFTDGVLVVRYLFGFRGQTLIEGAIGPGATRFTAGAVEGNIDGLIP